MWVEIRRKIFHLLSLVYVVGLVYIPRTRYLLLLLAAGILVLISETIRLRVPMVGEAFNKIFGPIMREREQKTYSGLFWMLIGVFLTVFLVDSVPVAATAILYLILGDAMAALIGIRFKGPTWPNGNKRVSGSMACFLTCLLIGNFLLRPAYSWSGVIAGALTATVVEIGFFPVDDNVTIPVASALVLMLCYGITPFF
jgi:dolichol kinase